MALGSANQSAASTGRNLHRPAAPRSGPWWKYGHMWLVVGGPLVVVVASFITLYLAISTPDPVYSERRGASTRDARDAGGAQAFGMAPAMQARNHAATGELPATLEVGKEADSAAAGSATNN